jgi:hypothetical protein
VCVLLLSKASSDAVSDGISYLVSSLAEIRFLSQSIKSNISKKTAGKLNGDFPADKKANITF